MADLEDEIARRFTDDPGVPDAAEKEAREQGVASGSHPDGALDRTGAVAPAQARHRRGDYDVYLLSSTPRRGSSNNGAALGPRKRRLASGEEYREGPLNALARQVVEQWLGERKLLAVIAERAVFLGRGGTRLSRRSVDDVVRRVGNHAGMTLSPPVLRHTC